MHIILIHWSLISSALLVLKLYAQRGVMIPQLRSIRLLAVSSPRRLEMLLVLPPLINSDKYEVLCEQLKTFCLT
jgi:hypothetical protein